MPRKEVVMTEKQLQKKLGAVKYFANIQNNQVVFTHTKGDAFYSYGTLIGARIEGVLYLTEAHDHSKTTSKYCGQWCGYDLKQRRKMIDSGDAVLVG